MIESTRLWVSYFLSNWLAWGAAYVLLRFVAAACVFRHVSRMNRTKDESKFQ
jgi:hypothetical protein